MEQEVAEEAAVAGSQICVRPVHASYWKEAGRDGVKLHPIRDPSSCAGLEKLEEAVRYGRTVWIEARLGGLEGKAQEWFEGSLEAWDDSMGQVPGVSWRKMDRILTAVDLESPKPIPAGHEPPATRLLRAIPYLYVQGTFATIRDLRLGTGVFDRLGVKLRDRQTIAFPAVGFDPNDTEVEQQDLSYTMVRTMVGVVKGTVITVRLPDIGFSGPDEGGTAHRQDTNRLVVPRRFFPFLKTPDGQDVAEAIGIHQATTARAVVGRIRNSLNENEKLARELNGRGDTQRSDPRNGPTYSPDRRTGPADRRRQGRPERPDGLPDRRKGRDGRRREDAEPREGVVDAREETSKLSEIAHRLDQQIARVLRRFGGSIADLPRPTNNLVPNEVNLRYGFALDDVRQLRDDCQLASRTIDEALTTFDGNQRERLQFIAALLASVVLIPTLIASVFGVNLGVPGEGSVVGFIAFVGAIAGLGLIGYSTLRKSARYHWNPPKGELWLQAVGAVAIVIFLVVVLALVS